jgi:hypothetical protein
MKILPTEFSVHSFFALDHAELWVQLDPFLAYISQQSPDKDSRLNEVSVSRSGTPFSTSRTQSYSRGGSSSHAAHDPYDDADDDNLEFSHGDVTTYYRKRTRAPSSVVDITRGADTSQKKPAAKKVKKAAGAVKVTGKLFVDSVITITAIPSTWTVPRGDTVYLLDLTSQIPLQTKLCRLLNLHLIALNFTYSAISMLSQAKSRLSFFRIFLMSNVVL